MNERHPRLTWGEIKAWAEANGVTDDAVVETDDDMAARFIRDLSFSPAGEEGYKAVFTLQKRWG